MPYQSFPIVLILDQRGSKNAGSGVLPRGDLPPSGLSQYMGEKLK
jgi:hypothetical protein